MSPTLISPLVAGDQCFPYHQASAKEVLPADDEDLLKAEEVLKSVDLGA